METLGTACEPPATTEALLLILEHQLSGPEEQEGMLLQAQEPIVRRVPFLWYCDGLSAGSRAWTAMRSSTTR